MRWALCTSRSRMPSASEAGPPLDRRGGLTTECFYCILPSIDDGEEKRIFRAAARNTRPSDLESTGSRDHAWVRHRATPEGEIRRRFAGRRELALSGSPAPVIERLGGCRMGRFGKQPARALLQTDARRTKATGQ